MKTTLTFAQQADLLARASRGDPEALAQLLEHFAPRWTYWLQTRWNCSPAEAEDFVADLRVVYLVSGPPHTHPYQFIAMSKKRLGWLVLGRNRRAKIAPQDSLEGLVEGAGFDGEKLGCLADKHDQMGHALSRIELTLALAQLRPVIADVLKLYYDQGWLVEEIAESLALPAGTVKSHLSIGRKALKKLLAT